MGPAPQCLSSSGGMDALSIGMLPCTDPSVTGQASSSSSAGFSSASTARVLTAFSVGMRLQTDQLPEVSRMGRAQPCLPLRFVRTFTTGATYPRAK